MVRAGFAALFAPARRAGAVALTLVALCSCAPDVAPRGLTNEIPAIENDAFVTRDGTRLPLRHWNAEKPTAVIAALHGMSDYSEAFDLPGPWLARHGVSVYAYDQRGFGASPHAGLWAGTNAMCTDLDDFAAALHAKFPGLPVYALGESMGGSVVLVAMTRAQSPSVDGVILVAPAVWSRADMPVPYRMVLWLAAHTIPSMHVSGEGLHIWATDNIAELHKLSRDPLYQHSARVDQVYGLVDLMDEARAAPAHLQSSAPILFLYGGKDEVIPAGPTQAVARELGPRATVIRYPKGYHMLLRDLEAEPRWQDMLDWIANTNATGGKSSSGH